MKKTNLFINLALAGMLALTLFALLHPSSPANAEQFGQATGPGEACNTGRSVNVSGTAVVNVIPDRALIQLGVESNGVTPSEVEAANARAIQRVIQAIQALGVESKDMPPTATSSSPFTKTTTRCTSRATASTTWWPSPYGT